MKIMILADSRAMWPQERPWPAVLQATLGEQHEVHSFVSGVNDWLLSIYQMEEYVVRNFPATVFDLIIVQTGWHVGGPCFWPANIWEQIVTTSFRKFDKEKLTQPFMHKGTEKFLYHDRDADKSVFKTLKSRSKHCIFLGMHSLRPENDLDKDYMLGLGHHYEALTANNEFMQHADEFNLPMDDSWKAQSCRPDGIHYIEAGVDFLVNYIMRFLSRAGRTINNTLPMSTKHTALLEKSKLAGTDICCSSEPGDTVLISGESGASLMHAFLGCVLYGRRPLIIQQPSAKVSGREFRNKMLEIQQKVKPALCMCSTDNQNIFAEFFNTKQIAYATIADEVHTASPDDVAFCQLSSGTTGAAKILTITHKQLFENIHEYATEIKLADDSCVVSWLPLYHDMGLITSFLMPVLLNYKFVLQDPFEWLAAPETLMKQISENKGTHVWMPNFAFAYMQKIDDASFTGISLESLKYMISCSEPTYQKYTQGFIEKFAKFGMTCQISNCYAMAENVFAVSQSDMIKTATLDEVEFVSCGKAIPGVSILINNEHDDDLPERTIGRVMIRSSATTVTIDKNRFGYYDTGDFGFIEDGELYITGRQNDAFVSFGNNIYPHLVELTISETDIIGGRIVCFPNFDDKKGTNECVVVIESLLEESNEIHELSLRVRKTLKAAFDISAKVTVEKPAFIIKTSSGKPSRYRTAKKYQIKKDVIRCINDILDDETRVDQTYRGSLYDCLTA